jgi:hypothetical protein
VVRVVDLGKVEIMSKARVVLVVVGALVALVLGLACGGGGGGKGEPVKDKRVCMDRHGFNTPCPKR